MTIVESASPAVSEASFVLSDERRHSGLKVQFCSSLFGICFDYATRLAELVLIIKSDDVDFWMTGSELLTVQFFNASQHLASLELLLLLLVSSFEKSRISMAELSGGNPSNSFKD